MFQKYFTTTILLWLLIISFFPSCTQQNINGQLIFQQPQPESGFHFPYFIFIPDGTDTTRRLTLIVEPNNSGFVSDDLEEHIIKARRTASIPFYTGNYVSQKLQVPLLVPVFPRPETDWHIYTHAFDRDLAIQKGNDLERLDLQLLSIIDDAGKILKGKGFHLQETFFLTGFSASGSFANRFTAIHPDKVKAVAAGGLNGLLILPVSHINGNELDFPVGVTDFQQLFGKPFNSSNFSKTPQFWYMGELDDNDAVRYDDGYNSNERNIIYSVLGEKMQPTRWNNCKTIYEGESIKAVIRTYPECGHEQKENIKAEIAAFFNDYIND